MKLYQVVEGAVYTVNDPFGIVGWEGCEQRLIKPGTHLIIVKKNKNHCFVFVCGKVLITDNHAGWKAHPSYRLQMIG